ncbi:SEC12-like protein 2 [Apium graveolens]|uniref:SEC12-like protein 2 n=1 Tax=Apium graveolens TaxID=4045 RepID=UPI003D797082
MIRKGNRDSFFFLSFFLSLLQLWSTLLGMRKVKNPNRGLMVISNSKIYGVPLYGCSWLPLNLQNHPHIHPAGGDNHHNDATDEDDHDHDHRNDASAGDNQDHDRDHRNDVPDHHNNHNDNDGADEFPPSINATRLVVLAGGGGEGNIGIPNALLISEFDVNSNSLSDDPLSKLGTGADLPYRMALHPGGEGLICSMPKSCRWFEWDAIENDGVPGWSLKSSEKIFQQLEDVGQQLALTFDDEGSVLAVGGENGKLRVYKWPSMESILDESNAHASVKDLAFSPDGKFLASVGSSGPGRVWDIALSAPIASLKRVKDERFGFCRFSISIKNRQILYITTMQDQGGSIVKWNTTSWKRISSKRITRDSITAFSASADGKYLAVGTMEGDILVLHSSSMQVHTVVKKAHLGILTSLMFSHDSRALLSSSFDSSARVTLIEDKEERGWSLWVILFILLLAMVVYYSRLVDMFLEDV